MIGMYFDCNVEDCEAEEWVDAYRRDLDSGTPIGMYLPEYWTLVGTADTGYPVVKCPTHR